MSQLERARLDIVHLRVDEANGVWRAVDSALRVSATTLGVARVGVWFVTADRKSLYRARVHDARHDAPEEDAVLDLVRWPAYVEAITSRRAVAADDVTADPRTRELFEDYCGPLGITSMLDAPLFLTGEVHGIVCHEHLGERRTWTQREIDFAMSVADMIGALLEQSMRLSAERRLRTSRETSVAARTAAGIAHDVNTVLAAVSASAEAARRTSDEREREAALQAILEDCRRSSRILEHLRELERPARPPLEAIDVGVVVRDLGATLEAIIGAERSLVVDASEGALAQATRTDVERIVMNLVTNARDATPRGGTVRITAGPVRETARLEVADEGSGVMTEPARLFEPHFTTKDDPGGGLGLFIVAVLASRSGGAVSFDSDPGRGTVFRVVWPLTSVS